MERCTVNRQNMHKIKMFPTCGERFSHSCSTHTDKGSALDPRPPGFSSEWEFWFFSEGRIWNPTCNWQQLTPYLQFGVTCWGGLFFRRCCSCVVLRWLAQWLSLCGACMFLRGLSSGCPVPSHRSESCTLAWLEAGLAPWLGGWGVGGERYVCCDGLVTWPEWIPASCQVAAWRASSTSHDLD